MLRSAREAWRGDSRVKERSSRATSKVEAAIDNKLCILVHGALLTARRLAESYTLDSDPRSSALRANIREFQSD